MRYERYKKMRSFCICFLTFFSLKMYSGIILVQIDTFLLNLCISLINWNITLAKRKSSLSFSCNRPYTLYSRGSSSATLIFAFFLKLILRAFQFYFIFHCIGLCPLLRIWNRIRSDKHKFARIQIREKIHRKRQN